MSAPCQTSSFRACAQLESNELPSEAPLHDPRVKAAVIVDPLPAFLLPADNLKAVTIPVQSWSSDPSLNADHLSGCCAAQWINLNFAVACFELRLRVAALCRAQQKTSLLRTV